MNIDKVLESCLSNMKASTDFSDPATVKSFKDLLECIIEKPSMLIGFDDKEKLSTALLGILVSQFASNYKQVEGLNVRNLVFITSYYLFMQQLETGMFYDREWAAFVSLIHYGRNEFANFIIEMNPFAPERINTITGKPIDTRRALNVAKGVELLLLQVAKKKGVWMSELSQWYDELFDDMDELLRVDPFRKEALPLYQAIANYLKEDDVAFVNI
jgi:hypothetical protein